LAIYKNIILARFGKWS